MEINVKKHNGSTIKAVIGCHNLGLFLEDTKGQVFFLRSDGLIKKVPFGTSLEILAKDEGRTVIYEGDTIEITF